LERATRKAKGEDFGMGAFFKSIDTVLMGRKTYEIALHMGMGKGGYPRTKNRIRFSPGRCRRARATASSSSRATPADSRVPEFRHCS
jgi:hypothetical protein